MKLNRNTKKANRFIDAYKFSCYSSLDDCYKSYSQAKALADASCREKMMEMNGWGFSIFSFNSTTFTCGWLYTDPETGVIMLNVETAYNSYQIEY